MKNLSVSTFIHILFSITISILVITFILFLSWNKDRQKINEYKRYKLISLTFISNLQQNPTKKILQTLYKGLNLKEIDKTKVEKLKMIIAKKGNTIFTGGSSLGKVRVFKIANKNYIYVQRMQHNLLLEDSKEKNYYFEIAVIFGIFLILLLFIIYFAVLKKLYPLKKLNREIQKFAEGNMKTKISYVYDDEIGEIAKSFDGAIKHINNLSSSKALFMRNMMHELKTPITKGRIIVEMIDDEMTKDILIRAFDRMNELILELAEIERVTTRSFEPNFEYVMLSEVIESAQDLLLSTNQSNIILEIEDRALTTDIKLLSLALKNLLDNGIKYGEKKQVTLKTTNTTIEVISKGIKLKHPLSYYVEPFSQEEKRSAGFGLGLYIVNSIIEKLGCSFKYKYIAGYNIFYIQKKDSCGFGINLIK